MNEEIHALRRMAQILARVATPIERQNIARRVAQKTKGDNSELALSLAHAAALFWPGDTEKTAEVLDQITRAFDAGELGGFIPREHRHILFNELTVWPDCPPMADDSPLRYWLPYASEQSDERPQAESANQETFNYAMLATPEKLIEAFGSMSGMNLSWFRSMKDRPALNDAVVIKGVRGRNGVPPLLDVFSVMQYLIDPKRRGKKLPEETGWRLLKAHFPKVYAAHESYDPTVTD